MWHRKASGEEDLRPAAEPTTTVVEVPDLTYRLYLGGATMSVPLRDRDANSEREVLMTRPKIYVTRGVDPSVLARLAEVCDTRSWTGADRCPADQLEKEIAEVDAVLGTDHWTAALMDKASRLRIIALTAVGFDSSA